MSKTWWCCRSLFLGGIIDLNWGEAKTGNWRVDKTEMIKARMVTDGDLETEERLMTQSLIKGLRIGGLPSCEVQVTVQSGVTVPTVI